MINRREVIVGTIGVFSSCLLPKSNYNKDRGSEFAFQIKRKVNSDVQWRKNNPYPEHIEFVPPEFDAFCDQLFTSGGDYTEWMSSLLDHYPGPDYVFRVCRQSNGSPKVRIIGIGKNNLFRRTLSV